MRRTARWSLAATLPASRRRARAPAPPPWPATAPGAPPAAQIPGITSRCRRRPSPRASSPAPAATTRTCQSNRTRRELTDDARRHRAEARRGAPLVPRLPRRGQPRLAAPGQRRAGAVRGIVPALRPVPRREVPRLARRRARPPHRRLERREAVPAVRPLPQPAPAALQAAGARSRRRSADPTRTQEHDAMEPSDHDTPAHDRRQFASVRRRGGGRLAADRLRSAAPPRDSAERLRERDRRHGSATTRRSTART